MEISRDGHYDDIGFNKSPKLAPTEREPKHLPEGFLAVFADENCICFLSFFIETIGTSNLFSRCTIFKRLLERAVRFINTISKPDQVNIFS